MLVDVNVGGLRHSLRTADDAFEVLEVVELHLVELQQFVVVECSVLKTALDDTLYLRTFQLRHHRLDIVRLHLRATDRDDRTEVEKLSQHFPVLVALLADLH